MTNPHPIDNLLSAFKALTEIDQAEARRMLEEDGYDLTSLTPKVTFFIDELRMEARLRLVITAMPESYQIALRIVCEKLTNKLSKDSLTSYYLYELCVSQEPDNQIIFMHLLGLTSYYYTYPQLALNCLNKLKTETK